MTTSSKSRGWTGRGLHLAIVAAVAAVAAACASTRPELAIVSAGDADERLDDDAYVVRAFLRRLRQSRGTGVTEVYEYEAPYNIILSFSPKPTPMEAALSQAYYLRFGHWELGPPKDQTMCVEDEAGYPMRVVEVENFIILMAAGPDGLFDNEDDAFGVVAWKREDFWGWVGRQQIDSETESSAGRR